MFDRDFKKWFKEIKTNELKRCLLPISGFDLDFTDIFEAWMSRILNSYRILFAIFLSTFYTYIH